MKERSIIMDNNDTRIKLIPLSSRYKAQLKETIFAIRQQCLLCFAEMMYLRVFHLHLYVHDVHLLN